MNITKENIDALNAVVKVDIVADDYQSKVTQLIENDPKFVQKKHSLFRVFYRKFITLGVNKIIVNNNFGKEYCTLKLKVNAAISF